MMADTTPFFTVLSIVLLIPALHSAEEYCYASDSNPYLNFSSRTAYESVYNRAGVTLPQGCQALQVWLLCRHGTRYPLSEEYLTLPNLASLRNAVLSNHQSNRGSLCQQDLANLAQWQLNMQPSSTDMLSPQGRLDLLGLGRRLASLFPHLLSSPYSPADHIFRHTHVSRTNESAVYFAKGVFGPDFNTPLPAAILHADPMLDPYLDCPGWSCGQEDSTRETGRMDGGQWMSQVIARVSCRLGFTGNLSLDNITTIYNACRYEKALNVSEVSPWCAAFTRLDLEVLEYRTDVKEWYKTGPGSEVNLRLACPLVRDMITAFREVVAHPEIKHPKAYLYFSHDWMVQMLSARLGLTQDWLPLTADDMPYQHDRQFRTSLMVPFAANIMAVLYNCSGGGLKVGLTLQERQVSLPGCAQGCCDWEHLDQLFDRVTRDPACTDLSFCWPNTAASSQLSAATLVVFIMFVLSHVN